MPIRPHRRALLGPICLLLLCLTWLASSGMANAQDANCTLPPIQTGQRPDPEGTPTTVSVAFNVIDILGVDDVNQNIQGDFLTHIEWTDPRLDGLAGCKFQATRVWTPDINVVNSASLTVRQTQARDRVTVGAGGRVRYVRRFSGSISTYHDLRRFPFDHQPFILEFTSVEFDASEVIIAAVPESSSIAPRLNIEDWNIRGLTVSSITRDAPLLDGEHSFLVASIEAERIYLFYVFKIILPMLLIVAMSWAVFWVPPEKYDFQIGTGATSFLTLIAFQFAVGGYLPRLGYFTTMDKLVLWSTFAVFVSIANSFVTARLVIRGKTEQARTLDRKSRYIVPAIYFAVFLLLLL